MKLAGFVVLLSSALALPSYADLAFSGKSYEDGVVTRWVGVADFDEDGNPDLVVSEPDSIRVVILLGNGNGNFDSRRVISFATVKLRGLALAPPLSGATGDLNGDGHVDLVLSTASGVVVLFGKGDATFRPSPPYLTRRPPWEWAPLQIADLDDDGKPDVIFPDDVYALHVLWQGAEGSFGPESTYATTHYGPDYVALGDFNKDGVLDAATSDEGHATWGWGLSVFLGHGKRSLGPATKFGATYWPVSIVAADLDHNGSLDLLTVGQQGELLPLFNRGDGSFDYGSASYGAATGLFNASLADLDQDGLLDLVVPTSRQLSDGSWGPCLFLSRGQGNGQFAIVDTVDYAANQWMVTAADLNHDTRPDLVTWANGVGVFLNQTPTVAAPSPQFELSFEAPRPNPVRNGVAFEFSLAKTASTTLSIIDLSGRLVATLASGTQTAGTHRVSWDLRARTGRRVGAGLYFARLNAGTRELVRRIEVLP